MPAVAFQELTWLARWGELFTHIEWPPADAVQARGKHLHHIVHQAGPKNLDCQGLQSLAGDLRAIAATGGLADLDKQKLGANVELSDVSFRSGS